MTLKVFPPDFLWSTSTAAYGIEGATEAFGRGPSIWDAFCLKPGVIRDGSDGRLASDHFNRTATDLDAMQSLGLRSYGFSMSWSRIIPDGIGPIHWPGMDHYDRLVDDLLERSIVPWITLHHWDLPLALEERGGWAKRDVIYHFAEYAQEAAARLGDRVKRWTTHFDPGALASLGYRTGGHAPGKSDARSGWMAAHHLLLSHAYAKDAVKSESQACAVGIELTLSPFYPASDSQADEEAARRSDVFENQFYLEPFYRGTYPEEALRKARLDSGAKGFDAIERGDLQRIHGSLDFLNVNYVTRSIVKASGSSGLEVERIAFRNKKDVTDNGFEVAPEGLTDLLVRLNQDYAPSILYVSGSGAAYGDSPDAEGRIRDHRRLSFYARHLEAILIAKASGVPVQGFAARSFLDGFEWTEGYERRQGLVWVDFSTQDRVFKDSAYWYAHVIETGSPAWDSSVDYRQ